MNKRTQRILLEMLIVIVVTVLLSWGFAQLDSRIQRYISGLSMAALIWLTLRHGSPTGILTAAISGAVLGFLQYGWTDVTSILLNAVLPLLIVLIAGFFAKNTQKTLNNRRLSSTYLNIYTATLLVILGYYLLKYVIIPRVVGQASIALSERSIWIGIVASCIIIGSLISLIAKHHPSFIIPKRSKYLSRKETTSLLND